MSKMSRYVYRLIEEGKLPMEIDDEYSNRKRHPNPEAVKATSVTVSGHAGRGFVSGTSASGESTSSVNASTAGVQISAGQSRDEV
jgi:hypothetical protein